MLTKNRLIVSFYDRQKMRSKDVWSLKNEAEIIAKINFPQKSSKPDQHKT